MDCNLIELSGFEKLGLPSYLLNPLSKMGYQTPFPIQQQTIPSLLEGRDVLGQAQTGTGKTAAFVLPLLARVDVKESKTQVLILSPTRELALQTAKACSDFAKEMPKLNVQLVCGGREYANQIHGLKKGAHFVVGTPGRIMDHIRNGILSLDSLRAVVLDEADEMLRMGFIDDVEWILGHVPQARQTALFSATMPNDVSRIAKKYLNNPVEVSLETRSTAASTIVQKFLVVSPSNKAEALVRVIEGEQTDGVIVFTRTKSDSVELAELLVQAGYRAAALNGDLAQAQREKTVEKFKNGKIDILSATDVAARGLDVDRVSHVINYDAPRDPESYVHRIGRCGRAGRKGWAVLFLSPRDRVTIKNVEKATGQKISCMSLPKAQALNKARIERFAEKISQITKTEVFEEYQKIVSEIVEKNSDLNFIDVAAALSMLLHNGKSMLANDLPETTMLLRNDKALSKSGRRDASMSSRRGGVSTSKQSNPRNSRSSDKRRPGDEYMESYRVQVGSVHGLRPQNLVGAIANEADLNSRFIGKIEIFDKYSTVDLPMGMPVEMFKTLSKVKVCNRPLNLQRQTS